MKIRATGVLLKDDSILLLEQNAENKRAWSLPGGKVEEGEPLGSALIREMREETGLEVEVGDLLYVCDNITDSSHVLHITFLVSEVGGKLGDVSVGLDTNVIKNVTFVPVSELESHGFSTVFADLVRANFPNRGSYPGPKSAIGL